MDAITMKDADAPGVREAALDRLFADLDRPDAPGAILAIRSGDDVLYRRAFGLASVQHGTANHPNTRIRVASITKQFTCLALLLLQEKGLVDLDASVSTYLHGLAPSLGRATLRQMMAHGSGHRCTLEMGTVANGFAPQPAGWQSRALRRQRDVPFAPGTGQLYCNGTYVAMTDVIEARSGMTYERYVAENILAPLGMNDSMIVRDDRLMVPGLADPHVRSANGWRHPPADADLLGDGGLVSTVDDMLRWLAHLRTAKRVGAEASWRQMLRPFELANGFRSTYALGLKRHDYRGLEVIQHSGGLFGLNAQVLTIPEHATDVVIAINGAPASATRLAFQAVDICLSNAFKSCAPVRAGFADFAWLSGRRFALPSGLLIGFGDAAGSLGLSQMHMHPAPVIYDKGERLVTSFEDIGFGPLAWKRQDLLALRDDAGLALPVDIAGERHLMCPLAAPTRAAKDLLAEAADEYRSEELAASLVIKTEGDTAVVWIKGDYSGRRSFTVEPLSERHFGIVSEDGEERYALSLGALEAGRTSHVWIDTHRARRLRFERGNA